VEFVEVLFNPTLLLFTHKKVGVRESARVGFLCGQSL
jgi:hypothetical protein